MEFKTINLSFLLCMLVAKLLVFIIVSALTLTISYPRNFGYAGSLAILTTQSNDFALGYPLIKSLYGDSKPEMLNYLSLMAPIQLLILNPLGIMMLEYHKSKKSNKTCKNLQRNNCSSQGTSKSNLQSIDLNFLKALATNPLIIASVVALITNLTHGPELPKFVTRVSNTIAASFAAPALFVVGTSMCGKFELMLRNPNDLLLSSVLVLVKVLILPNLMRTLTLFVVPYHTPAEEVPYLIDFSFLYGLLPTAPTACIIAKQYGILPDVISISMLLSTFTSAPLMLAASAIINPANAIKVASIERLISQTVKVSSVMTFMLAFLTIYAIWKSKDRLNYTSFMGIPEATFRRMSSIRSDPTKIFLLLLSISQLMIGVGGIIWSFVESGKLEVVGPNNPLVPMLDVDQDPLASISTTRLPSTLVNESSEVFRESLQDATTFPVSLLSSDPQIDTLPLHEPFDTWQVPHQMDFSLKTIIAAQYVFSSSGLMMSKFVTLCIILVVAAKQSGGYTVASRASSLLAKIYVLLGVTLLLWLVYDCDQSKRIAVDPSLPSGNGSLIVRLVFNVVFVCISMPVFALIIREDNKRKIVAVKKKIEIEQQTDLTSSSTECDVIGEIPSFTKPRFITSNVSLSSDSSSALTSNTNLELASTSAGPSKLPSADPNNGAKVSEPHNQLVREPLTIVIDCHRFNDSNATTTTTTRKSPPSSTDVVMSSSIPYSSYDERPIIGADKQHMSDRNGNHLRNLNQTQVNKRDTSNRSYDPEDSPISDTVSSLSIEERDQLQTSEFNKYSILIVFMLIESILNLTSITQKLIQDQPSGTFRQIEVISVALEFGQGLLTFLIYGMGRLLK